MNPVARATGQACSKGFLGIVVKEPKCDEGDRNVEFKYTHQGVADSVPACEWDEVSEIGSEAAEDQGRNDQARPPEGECGRSVGKSKGHYMDYDGFERRWTWMVCQDAGKCSGRRRIR